MISKSKYLYIITSVFIITSCGGGGGGGGGSVPQLIAAVISSFTSSSPSVEVGSTVDLSWSASNASSCSASWTNQTSTSGTETVTVSSSGNNTFSITCSGEGGNDSKSIIIEGYRNINGISVDGYMSGASIFIDENQNYILDSNESETSSSVDGSFTIKFNNGLLVSLGGQDADTQTQLDGLLLLRDIDGYSDESYIISPITSVSHFMPSSNVNDVLGIDNSIDIFTTDPVENLNKDAAHNLLYEKGNQLTVLAYSLQNISNDLNSSSDSTIDYFKAISEEMVLLFADTSQAVNIEKSLFVENVLDNLILSKSLPIDESNKTNAVKALSAVLPVIGVKANNDLTSSVIRFSTNKFQNDFLKIVNGTADQQLITAYSTDILNYIAEDQNVNIEDIQPVIIALSDEISLDEDASISFSPLLNDELTPGSPYTLSVSSASNGTTSISEASPDQITYVPNQHYNGQDSFSYTITQGNLSSSADISVSILSINDAPLINLATSINYSENDTEAINTSIVDVDGDELEITLSGDDANFFNLSNNLLTFISPPDFETKSSYSITITVSDGVLTDEKIITINIIDINEQLGYKVPTSIDVIETKE